MPVPSRQMPKLRRDKIQPFGWLVPMMLDFALLCAIAYVVSRFPFLLIPLAVVLIASIVMHGQNQRRLQTLATQRVGESIGDFARSLEYRTIDTWVIRATYEQIQAYMGSDLPLRACDRLIEDLQIDPEDLEMDLAEEIAERTGRTLAETDRNPYYGKVETVQDLVLFFNAQPRR
jgi:hypothetical protein